MQSFKKIVSDFTMKRLFWLVLGTAILSFGIHNIHQRAAITEGGVIGLVLLLNHWLGIPASIASPLLDFICYALAFKFLGLDFILTAAVASVSLAGFYRLWESFPPMLPDMTPWPLAAALLGLTDEARGYAAPGLTLPREGDGEAAVSLRYGAPQGRNAVGLLRAVSETLARVQPVYYRAEPQGGPQGPYRITALE